MAFASRFRHVLCGSSTPSPILQFAPMRHNSTLTTPKLFVSGLSRSTTDEGLTKAFSEFGQLVEAKVITEKTSGRSKGFGFVTYATVEEAKQAQEKMNAKFLDGWVIFVDPAKPRQPRPPPSSEPAEPSETGFRVNKTVGWCG